MHSAVKLIIGLIIFAAGIYWYLPPGTSWTGAAALDALKTVFIGVFGLFLIILGFIIAWIEYEDLKWEAKEKKEVKAATIRRRKR
jgi:hypothetical protein